MANTMIMRSSTLIQLKLLHRERITVFEEYFVFEKQKNMQMGLFEKALKNVNAARHVALF